jgi:hypothetical protein
VDKPTRCPECGSSELHDTKRVLADYTEVKATVCGVCHWASDPRVGRPPADRGKNVTLQRLMRDAKPEEAPPASGSDEG